MLIAQTHVSLRIFITHLNVDLNFQEMPLTPNTHFKKISLYGWGVVALPHIKKKKKKRKSGCTAGGWDDCMCLLRKPVGKNS